LKPAVAERRVGCRLPRLYALPRLHAQVRCVVCLAFRNGCGLGSAIVHHVTSCNIRHLTYVSRPAAANDSRSAESWARSVAAGHHRPLAAVGGTCSWHSALFPVLLGWRTGRQSKARAPAAASRVGVRSMGGREACGCFALVHLANAHLVRVVKGIAENKRRARVIQCGGSSASSASSASGMHGRRQLAPGCRVARVVVIGVEERRRRLPAARK
jgi:hypothetical protein